MTPAQQHQLYNERKIDLFDRRAYVQPRRGGGGHYDYNSSREQGSLYDLYCSGSNKRKVLSSRSRSGSSNQSSADFFETTGTSRINNNHHHLASSMRLLSSIRKIEKMKKPKPKAPARNGKEERAQNSRPSPRTSRIHRRIDEEERGGKESVDDYNRNRVVLESYASPRAVMEDLNHGNLRIRVISMMSGTAMAPPASRKSHKKKKSKKVLRYPSHRHFGHEYAVRRGNNYARHFVTMAALSSLEIIGGQEEEEEEEEEEGEAAAATP